MPKTRIVLSQPCSQRLHFPKPSDDTLHLYKLKAVIGTFVHVWGVAEAGLQDTFSYGGLALFMRDFALATLFLSVFSALLCQRLSCFCGVYSRVQ